MFPHGSYGNGGADARCPVGLASASKARGAMSLAIESSRPTHSHPLAFAGGVLQAVAVTTAAAADECAPAAFLRPLRAVLRDFDDLMQDTSTLGRSTPSNAAFAAAVVWGDVCDPRHRHRGL